MRAGMRQLRGMFDRAPLKALAQEQEPVRSAESFHSSGCGYPSVSHGRLEPAGVTRKPF